MRMQSLPCMSTTMIEFASWRSMIPREALRGSALVGKFCGVACMR